MALHFNINGFMNELLLNLEKELQSAFNQWENEVKSKLRNNEFKSNAQVETEIKKESKKIISYLKANTYVLADSYGTGSLMLSDNPGYSNYILNSDKINPARTGKAIMGRPKGKYTDIFGKEHETSGAFEGINIEYKTVNSSKKNKYRIEPVAPSKAVQIANQWLYDTYLNRAYQLAIKETNFNKFLIED